MSYHKDEDHNEILEYLKDNASKNTDKMTYKQALCDP